MSCIWPPGLHLRNLAPRSKIWCFCCHWTVPYLPICSLSLRSQSDPWLVTQKRYYFTAIFIDIFTLRDISMYYLWWLNEWVVVRGEEKVKNKLLSSIVVFITEVQQALLSSVHLCLCIHFNIINNFTIGYLLLTLQFHTYELTLKHTTRLERWCYSLSMSFKLYKACMCLFGTIYNRAFPLISFHFT